MFRTLTTALLGALLALPSAVIAQEGTARAQLERFSAGLETLHARFEQRVVNRDGEVEDASEGEVWLARPQRFRWAYGGDFPELVVANGRRVWIYDEVLEQVTIKDQSAIQGSPLTLLTEPGRLEEQFAVREAGDSGDLQLLELRALSAESEFERLLVGFSDDTLRLLIMEDAFGLRTELRFSELQRNLDLMPSLFVFEPPEGVDVIGDDS